MKEKKSRELQIPMNFYKSKKRNGRRKYSSRNKGVIEKISYTPPHKKTCLVDYRPKQEHVKSVKYKEGWGNCLHD